MKKMKTVNEIVHSEVEKVKNKFENEKRFLGYEHDIHVLEAIPEKKLRNALEVHKLSVKEEVYLLVDCTLGGSAKNSVLFLLNGFSICHESLKNGQPMFYNWENIKKIEYKLSKFILTFKDEQKNNDEEINEDYFLSNINSKYRNEFINLINKIAEKFDNKELRLRKQIENENDSKNKIELCTKYLNDFPDEDEIVRKIKAIAYYSINEFDKSYKEFERLLKQNNDYEYLKYKGLCLKQKSEYYNSIFTLTKAINIDSTDSHFLKEQILDSYDLYKKDFLNLPILERQFVFIDNDFRSSKESNILNTNNFKVLIDNNFPSDIVFLPYSATGLYQIHPLKNNTYLLVDKYKDLILNEQLTEVKSLLGELGAKRYSITKKQGHFNYDIIKRNQKDNSQLNVNVQGENIPTNIGQLDFEVNVNKKKQTNKKDEEMNNTTIENESIDIVEYDILDEISVSGNYIWIDNLDEWKNLKQQRLNKSINLSKRNISLSTKQTSIFQHKAKEILLNELALYTKISLSNIIGFKASIDNNHLMKNEEILSVYSEEETNLVIDIEFYSYDEIEKYQKLKATPMLVNKNKESFFIKLLRLLRLI
jgi:hypothetical protein